MERYPIIITIGAALIGFVAGEMAWEDQAIAALTSPYPATMKYVAAAIGAAFVVVLGQWLARRQARAAGETPANPAQ
jgi:predicted tellurium resistance membrane protein TerC